MKYDLSKPESLPLTLGAHIIVDTRTGVTFRGVGHHAWEGFGQALKSMTGTEEGDPNGKLAEAFGDESAQKLIDFSLAVFFAMLSHDKSGLDEFVNQPDKLIRVGPFVTWDECLHNKHSEMITQRMERFAASEIMRPVHPEEIDVKIAAQMRKDIVDQREIIAAEKTAKASTTSSRSDPLEEIMNAVFGGTGLGRGRR